MKVLGRAFRKCEIKDQLDSVDSVRYFYMKRTSTASSRPQTRQWSLHIVLALLCLRAAPAFSTIDTLVVLHTNDFHGYISPDGDRAAGLARIATYFDRERARSSKVLALDAGDCVSGTPAQPSSKGDRFLRC